MLGSEALDLVRTSHLRCLITWGSVGYIVRRSLSLLMALLFEGLFSRHLIHSLRHELLVVIDARR